MMKLRLRRREVQVGDVDRDSLLPLCFEAVGQQGQVDLPPGVARDGRVLAHRGQVVVVEEVRVVQEPPDQCRLAVVHRAAGEQAKQIVPRDRAVACGFSRGHQK